MQTLKKGSQCTEVKRLQAMLKIPADGVFGPNTETAVKVFQQQHGLVADGVVGSKTWAALDRPDTALTETGKYALSQESLKKLEGVHPDLVKVIKRAIQISPFDFKVTEGVRTMARQKQLVKEGKSKTTKGRHIPENNACKMSCAVDLAVMIENVANWDFANYKKLADAVKQAAREVGVPIEWGGDWTTLKDGPHFQLPWSAYK